MNGKQAEGLSEGDSPTPRRAPRIRYSAEVERTGKALRLAMRETPPSCRGDMRFTQSRPGPLPAVERRELSLICFDCPVFIECHAYATAFGATAGFWAGRNYGTWERIDPEAIR